jgi:hypothetical protein
MFHFSQRFRKAVVWITTHSVFDAVILLLIFANSIFLAVTDYSDRDNLTTRNKIVSDSGQVFTVVFTIECLCRIITMGFV